jgi:DMSO/TMAO reductase YedYZ molybdopterin-dependent catalytic subunit/mono/diheme cytochrome c family protein
MYAVNRRFILKSLAASVGLALTPISFASSARTLPVNKQAADFVIHNDLPWALETMRGSFGFGPITPLSRFFVRNNLPMPPASILDRADEWSFKVEGCVGSGSLSLRDLKSMRVQTVASVLQCSGNGRAYSSHNPSGSQWSVGAAGCALWTGVAVADIFEKFGGVSNEAAFLTGTGGESLPEGIDASMVAVERSVPIQKGLEDCMLVWEMNGAPLPLAHGGPLRLLVPGYFGVNNVKWLTRLAATAQESTAKIQQSGYRLRAIGESGGLQHPSMWRMPVKSWLNGPGANGRPVKAGAAMLYGVAFSGERGVDKVEVSGDNGKSWQDAQWIGPDLGVHAWRTFSIGVNLGVGENRYVTRAIDSAGDIQPELAIPNERGYGNNGWADHGLNILAVDELPETASADSGDVPMNVIIEQASKEKTYTLSKTAQRGRAIFTAQSQPNCSVCHTLDAAQAKGLVGPNLDKLKPGLAQIEAAVVQGVGAMPAYGGQLSGSEVEALSAFVFEGTR